MAAGKRGMEKAASAAERSGEEQPLRLFVAVPAPRDVVLAAERVVAAMRGAGDVRWVAAEQFHLTLKFLGATPPARVPELVAALRESANEFSRFVVYLEGTGAFPSRRRPQTLWLGVGGGETETLAALAEAVDRAVHPLGFPREVRPYRPHLTLGRVRSPRGLDGLVARLEEQIAASAAAEPVPWPVEAFHLVRSELRPEGARYTPLEVFPLRIPESQRTPAAPPRTTEMTTEPDR